MHNDRQPEEIKIYKSFGIFDKILFYKLLAEIEKIIMRTKNWYDNKGRSKIIRKATEIKFLKLITDRFI